MNPLEQRQTDRLRAAVGDKPHGSHVEVAAADLAAVAGLAVTAAQAEPTSDPATTATARTFASGATGFPPAHRLVVQAEQLRAVLALLDPPEPVEADPLEEAVAEPAAEPEAEKVEPAAEETPPKKPRRKRGTR